MSPHLGHYVSRQFSREMGATLITPSVEGHVLSDSTAKRRSLSRRQVAALSDEISPALTAIPNRHLLFIYFYNCILMLNACQFLQNYLNIYQILIQFLTIIVILPNFLKLFSTNLSFTSMLILVSRRRVVICE